MASLVSVTAVFVAKASSGPVAVGIVAGNAAVQLAKLITIVGHMVDGQSFADATTQASKVLEVLDILTHLESAIVEGLGKESKLLYDLKQAKEQIMSGKPQDMAEAFSKVAEIACEFLSEISTPDVEPSLKDGPGVDPVEQLDIKPTAEVLSP